MSSVVHIVQWFVQFSGSCSSVVHSSYSSVVRAVQCSSMVRAIQWFVQFSGLYSSVVRAI